MLMHNLWFFSPSSPMWEKKNKWNLFLLDDCSNLFCDSIYSHTQWHSPMWMIFANLLDRFSDSPRSSWWPLRLAVIAWFRSDFSFFFQLSSGGSLLVFQFDFSHSEFSRWCPANFCPKVFISIFFSLGGFAINCFFQSALKRFFNKCLRR